MPLFIKTEIIKKTFLNDVSTKNKTIKEHKLWVKKLIDQGIYIKSGFLVDKDKSPGAGGLLIIECGSFEEAEILIREDPMVKSNIVIWNLNEWKDIFQ